MVKMLVAGKAELDVQALVLGLIDMELGVEEGEAAVELALAERGISELEDDELLDVEKAVEVGEAEAGPMLLGDAEDKVTMLELLEKNAADELVVDPAMMELELLNDVDKAELELLENMLLLLMACELLLDATLLELTPAEELDSVLLLELLLIELEVVDPPYAGGSPTDEDDIIDEGLELVLIIPEVELLATSRYPTISSPGVYTCGVSVSVQSPPLGTPPRIGNAAHCHATQMELAAQALSHCV